MNKKKFSMYVFFLGEGGWRSTSPSYTSSYWSKDLAINHQGQGQKFLCHPDTDLSNVQAWSVLCLPRWPSSFPCSTARNGCRALHVWWGPASWSKRKREAAGASCGQERDGARPLCWHLFHLILEQALLKHRWFICCWLHLIVGQWNMVPLLLGWVLDPCVGSFGPCGSVKWGQASIWSSDMWMSNVLRGGGAGLTLCAVLQLVARWGFCDEERLPAAAASFKW